MAVWSQIDILVFLENVRYKTKFTLSSDTDKTFRYLLLVYSIIISAVYKELGPRTAKLALSICLKMKMVEYVWKSTDLANGSLLISCL